MLDTLVVIVIQIVKKRLFKMADRMEILQIKEFTLEQAKEFFNDGTIRTVGFSAHALTIP